MSKVSWRIGFVSILLIGVSQVANAGIVVLSTDQLAHIKIGASTFDLQKGDLAQITVNSSGIATAGVLLPSILGTSPDLNAIYIRTNGNMILTVGAGTTVGTGAITYHQGDLVEYNPSTTTTVDGIAPGSSILYLKGNNTTSGNDQFGHSSSVFLNGSGQSTNGDVNDVHLIADLDSQILLATSSGAIRLGSPMTTIANQDIALYNPITNTASDYHNVASIFDNTSHGGHVDGLSMTDAGNLLISMDQNVSFNSTGGPYSFDSGDIFEFNQNSVTIDGLAAGAARLYFSHANFVTSSGNVDNSINIDAVHLVGGGVISQASDGSVPEPTSMAIWGLGALGCAVAGYRRRKLA
jgi:hypothetical protein